MKESKQFNNGKDIWMTDGLTRKPLTLGMRMSTGRGIYGAQGFKNELQNGENK
ncbi:hypothetical protein PATY110618_10835 [Paenibacillus typhae]